MPQTPARLDLESLLCFALYSTTQAMVRANKPMLGKVGLTYPQFLVMVVLWSEDNQTIHSIGDKLFLETSTLTPLLKRLEAAGLVRRARCPEDERQVRVSLTDRGKALQAEACEHSGAWLNRAFDNPDQAMTLHEGIVSVRERLRGEPQSTTGKAGART